MAYKKGEAFYEGKAKVLYHVQGSPDMVWFEYKDSLTAFNAQKKGSFPAKGKINRTISEIIFKYLAKNNINTHSVALISDNEVICRRLKMIPIEVVVRNVVAGSLAKKFNKAEGEKLPEPLVEFYYKDDALNDPFISDEQALWLKVASRAELEELKKLALQINHHLTKFFAAVSLNLVDFKLEFGKDPAGQIVLGDEISPDSCRLWDIATGEKMDKDRFRRDLGRVAESYEEVCLRIQKQWGDKA